MGLFPTDAVNGQQVTNTKGTTFEYDDVDDKWFIVSDLVISDIAYDEGTWDDNPDGATKNTIRDKIEAMITAFNAANMIGSGNSALIPCSYQAESSHETIDTTAGHLSNAGATDAWWIFSCPLPTNRGGKALHIGDVVIEIAVADADDFIDNITVEAVRDDATLNHITDGTNRTAQGTYTYAAAGRDVSAYSSVVVQLLMRGTTNGEFQLASVLLECYYDD